MLPTTRKKKFRKEERILPSQPGAVICSGAKSEKTTDFTGGDILGDELDNLGNILGDDGITLSGITTWKIPADILEKSLDFGGGLSISKPLLNIADDGRADSAFDTSNVFRGSAKLDKTTDLVGRVTLKILDDERNISFDKGIAGLGVTTWEIVADILEKNLDFGDGLSIGEPLLNIAENHLADSAFDTSNFFDFQRGVAKSDEGADFTRGETLLEILDDNGNILLDDRVTDLDIAIWEIGADVLDESLDFGDGGSLSEPFLNIAHDGRTHGAFYFTSNFFDFQRGVAKSDEGADFTRGETLLEILDDNGNILLDDRVTDLDIAIWEIGADVLDESLDFGDGGSLSEPFLNIAHDGRTHGAFYFTSNFFDFLRSRAKLDIGAESSGIFVIKNPLDEIWAILSDKHVALVIIGLG